MRCSCRQLLKAVVAVGLVVSAHAESDPAPGYSIAQNYAKQEADIPMRDGVRLHTRIYTPKDTSSPYPILLTRTPYYGFFAGHEVEGYFSFPGPGPTFPAEGYIFVIQDVRGRFLSEGDFQVMRPNTADPRDPRQSDESTDAYDTIAWLIDNVANHNGRVGVHGLSWAGYYAALALVNAHPSLAAVAIEAPVAEGFLGDDYHHNGALHLLYPFRWLNNMGLDAREGPSADVRPPVFPGGNPGSVGNYYDFFLQLGPLANINAQCFGRRIPFWNDIMEHGTYDAYWRTRNLPQYLKDIDGVAILVAGSWFDDQDLYGTLRTYRAIEEQNPGANCSLVMGVWNHASWWTQKHERWGKAGLPAKGTADHYRDEVLAPFFRSHLKEAGDLDLPEALAYASATGGWRSYGSWPPPEAVATPLYLAPGGRLSPQPLTDGGETYSCFESDPAAPVPHLPAHTIAGWNAAYMHADQRFAAARSDVLVFQGEALANDTTVAGPIEVELYVATTGTDADWVVKVIDVHPEDQDDPEVASELAGCQMLVRGDIMRGKFRNSFASPEPFTPGEVTCVAFTLPDVHHVFRRGHRIMVQVQSSWFPLFDRNPQTFVDIYRATGGDFQAATHAVHHSREYPSRVTVGVLGD